MSRDIGYREAMSTIEAIVADLDNENIDVDELSEKVEEAVELIALCRAKLRATEKKVGVVLKQMGDCDDADADEDSLF